jgi:NAD(P)H-hydrate repair Nnr-like enzyme with NAD(P)H-hydrate epimerase domain
MRPVYASAEIRRIEQAHADAPLMERAGAAAADLAVSLLSDKGKDVLVLAGPGNNGGDAKVVERILKEKFFRTS